MTMKRCTKCAEKIQWSDLVCRFCGTQQSEPTGKEPMGATKKGCLWIAAIAAVILGLIIFGPRDRRVEAIYACDEKVYMGGQEYYKLSPEERMECRRAVINTPTQASE